MTRKDIRVGINKDKRGGGCRVCKSIDQAGLSRVCPASAVIRAVLRWPSCDVSAVVGFGDLRLAYCVTTFRGNHSTGTRCTGAFFLGASLPLSCSVFQPYPRVCGWKISCVRWGGYCWKQVFFLWLLASCTCWLPAVRIPLVSLKLEVG